MRGIKKVINDIMFVTGAALVILTVFSLLLDVEIGFVPTVFQIFAANIVIILGLFLRGKFEIRIIILEYLVDISWIIAVLIVCGLIFNWYSAIPLWILVVMAVVIYILGMIFTVSKIKRDAEELNKLLRARTEPLGDEGSPLQKHREKQADNAS